MKKLLLTAGIIVFMTAASASALTLQFTWGQNIDADFAGWRLWCSQTAGEYDTSAEPFAVIPYSGQTTYEYVKEISSSDMPSGTYYFVLTAFDANGNESGFSNEESVMIDFGAPEAPYNLTITIIVSQDM
jgi:hypothetical protein